MNYDLSELQPFAESLSSGCFVKQLGNSREVKVINICSIAIGQQLYDVLYFDNVQHPPRLFPCQC